MNKVQVMFDELYCGSYPTNCDFSDMIANIEDEPSMNSLISELEKGIEEE